MSAAQRFDRVMAEVLRHEGGYVDHPRDPGGATNMGITHRTLADWRGHPVTKDDVRNLTRAEALAIYRDRYWAVVRGDELPAGLDYVAMDAAVNAGPRRGVEWLQRGILAAGQLVAVDGVVGPETIRAAQAVKAAGRAAEAVKAACAARLAFKRRLPTWDVFGRGWARRVAEVEAKAVRWAVEDTQQPVRPVLIAQEIQAYRSEVAAQRSAGAAAVATPVAGVGVDQAVDALRWGWVPIILVGAVVVLIFVRQMVEARERKRAYREEALEAKP
jgi:lysozyme family protein